MSNFLDCLLQDVIVTGRQSRCLLLLRTLFVAQAGYRVMLRFRLAQYLQQRGYRVGAKLVIRSIESKFGVYIGLKTKIGSGVKLPHPVGIVIGAGVEIDQGCIIYQNVTLGGARDGDALRSAYPKIGKDVCIFAGAVIIGDVSVGAGSVVGANSVVTANMPQKSVIVGAPARAVKCRGDVVA